MKSKERWTANAKLGRLYSHLPSHTARRRKTYLHMGQRHLQYRKENKQFVYLNLLTSGRLNEYLASVDEQAEDMLSRLVKEYADRQGVKALLLFWEFYTK